jgi:hypothetical protein
VKLAAKIPAKKKNDPCGYFFHTVFDSICSLRREVFSE